MLSIPGSRLEVLRVLAALILRVLRVLRVFRAVILSDTSILAIFRGSILWLLPVLEVFLGSILLNTACTWSGVLHCSYFEYSQCQNYLNMRNILGVWVILRPSPHRFVSSRFWQKTFPDGPTSARSRKLISWGATEYLEFSGVYTSSTRSISGFCTADTLYSKYSGFDTADTPVLAVLLLLILHSTRSIQAFGTAHTPSTRSIQAFSTAHIPSTRSTKCTQYSEYTWSTKYTGSICALFN